MADKKISQLTALTGANTASDDVFAIVDTSVTETKKISLTELQSAPISAGTANGVAYLNGSKVLTTGSALTFDGTKLSLPRVLAIKGAQNSNISKIALTRTDTSWSLNNETHLRFYAQNADTESPANIVHTMMNDGSFIWNNVSSSSEQMRLTSTGLGIGTSSPAAKLDVVGTIRSQTSVFQLADGTTLGGGLYTNKSINGSGSDLSPALFAASGNGLQFMVNGSTTKAMQLDSSGNLGLGVTPSAWSGWRAFEFSNGKSLASFNSGGALGLTQNTFFNGSNWIYKGNATASLYSLEANGSFNWFTAPSGTAGNAISFTQALTLDANGNLLIGTTTAGASKLVVNSDSIQVNTAKTPASATATGTTGQIAWDANYMYVCVATNTWKRSAIATW